MSDYQVQTIQYLPISWKLSLTFYFNNYLALLRNFCIINFITLYQL